MPDPQNKEAEAKEELKRRARQLEMQRREQQKRAAALGGSGGGGSYLGGGSSGYAPVSRYEAPDAPTARMASPAPATASRPPNFKTGGMKLGSKKTRQAELLDALGGEVLAVEDMSSPPTPIPVEPPTQIQKDARGSLPSVTAERQVQPPFLPVRLDLTTLPQRTRCHQGNHLSLALARRRCQIHAAHRRHEPPSRRPVQRTHQTRPRAVLSRLWVRPPIQTTPQRRQIRPKPRENHRAQGSLEGIPSRPSARCTQMALCRPGRKPHPSLK